jgi:hypothetical protein
MRPACTCSLGLRRRGHWLRRQSEQETFRIQGLRLDYQGLVHLSCCRGLLVLLVAAGGLDCFQGSKTKGRWLRRQSEFSWFGFSGYDTAAPAPAWQTSC